ncbi:hypothetical protein AB3S75_037080 [Citrus x aurantiifolia]
METSFKSAILITLLVSSCVLFSISMPAADAQPQKQIPCKSDVDCEKGHNCSESNSRCLNTGFCLCIPGSKNCC